MPALSCPHCGRLLRVPSARLGKRSRCPDCEHSFVAKPSAPRDDREEQRRQRDTPPAEKKTAAKVAAPPAEKPGRGKGLPEQTTAPPAQEPSAEEGRRRKHKRPWVYVAASYPLRLGVASFAWALVGWLLAALTPHLAFLPLLGLLHCLLPLITVGLIAANLYLAVRELWRGAHPFCLLLVTGLQVCLFTTLFYQLFRHGGAELYDVRGPTPAWQWVGFSLAHAFRASDMLDVVEAYSLKIQSIKHDAALVAVFVLVYHTVIDVFCLGVIWEAVERLKRRFLRDEGIRILVQRLLIGAFVVWLLSWLLVAFWLHPWRLRDVALWLVENVIHVLDFPDVMETFDLRLHSLPREGLTGTFTFLCRLWIGIYIGLVLGRWKKKERDRRLATPPGESALPYWSRRAGLAAGMLAAMLVVAVLGDAVLGNPVARLTAAVEDGPEDRAEDALRALRRLGPTARGAVPALAAARRHVSEATRDEITQTLGYLGAEAIEPLTDIALHEGEMSAFQATESLEQVRAEAAPALVRIWAESGHENIRQQAAEGLERLGSEAVPVLMDATTPENAADHYHWLAELDANWRLRGTSNKTAAALQELPDLVVRLRDSREHEKSVQVLKRLRDCGSAAQVALPIVLDQFTPKSAAVNREATNVLLAMGPRATPELLKRLDDKNLFLAGGILTALADPAMWDDRCVKDPAAVPALRKLLLNAETPRRVQDLALRGLGTAGPAAREAVPGLVALLAHPDRARRSAVRDTLVKIDTDWKKHPQNCQAIPTLLPHLTTLPKEEGDELFDALGELQPADADAFVRVLTAGVSADKEKAYRDAVFAALERLGPRARAALPALTAFLTNHNAPFPTRMRLVPALKRVAPHLHEVMPAVVAFLGQGEAALAFVLENPDEALLYADKALDAGHPANCAFALQVAARLGPRARSLLPRLVARLGDSDRFVKISRAALRSESLPKSLRSRPREDFILSRTLLLGTLEAIDKDWAAQPAAAKALSGLLAKLPQEPGMSQQAFFEALERAGTSMRSLTPELIPVVFSDMKLFTPASRKALEAINPEWRADPLVKTLAPKLVARIDGRDISLDEMLKFMGDAAVPALRAGLDKANPEARRRIFDILKGTGKGSKEAVPALVNELASPQLSQEGTKQVLDSLRATDPDWASSPRAKEVLPDLLTRLAGQQHASGRYVAVCTAWGPTALPHVIGHLGGKEPLARRNALAALRDLGGDSKEALAAVQKSLKDREPTVRVAAVEALGKLGRGNKSLVAVVGPCLIDENYYVRFNTPGALKAMDPAWKTSPKFQPVLAQVLRGLSHPKPDVRFASLEALDVIGPANGVVAAVGRLAAQEKDQKVQRQATWVLNRLKQPPGRNPGRSP